MTLSQFETPGSKALSSATLSRGEWWKCAGSAGRCGNPVNGRLSLRKSGAAIQLIVA
jgi:hypothetical protein